MANFTTPVLVDPSWPDVRGGMGDANVFKVSLFGNVSAPAITVVSPAPGALGTTEDIVIDVTDGGSAIVFVAAAFTFLTAGVEELAVQWLTILPPGVPGTLQTFFDPYLSSTRVATTNGWRFTFHRDGGWPDTDVRLRVMAQSSTPFGATFDWTTTSTGEIVHYVLGDPPAFALVSPATPGPIADTAALVLDVTDPDGNLEGELLAVEMGSVTEQVWNGAAFVPPYATSSTRTPVTNGYRFSVVRDGGWRAASITLHSVAYDDHGNDATDTRTWSVTLPSHVPVITLISPASGGALGLAEDVVIEVTDPDGDLATFVPRFTRVDAGVTETAHDGSAFLAPYTSSTRTPITHGYRFTFRRTGGWQDTTVNFNGQAFDTDGGMTGVFYTWTVGFVAPTHPPLVTIESPTPGTTIGRMEPIVFTVTDEDAEPGAGGGLERALPVLLYPDGTAALIHDGDDFRELFEGSTREAIEGGYRYTVLPVGGWRQAPSLLPFAYDMTGLEAA